MLTDSQKATIVDLQSYLTRIAHNLHRTNWLQADPEDILAEMNLHIAERAEQDPTFLEQSPGYVTKAAAWHARHWLRNTYTRFLHGERVAAGLPLEADDEDSRPGDETFVSPQPDNDLALDVRAALAGLDEISFQIAQLKMQGWKRQDIATELGTSSQNLTRYLHRIEAALSPIWAAMTGEGDESRQLAFGL